MGTCPICARRFSRKDSLKRHVKMHDKSPKLRRKSCNFCQRSKIKCSGTRPLCAECARRQVPCEWPTPDDNPRTMTALSADLSSRSHRRQPPSPASLSDSAPTTQPDLSMSAFQMYGPAEAGTDVDAGHGLHLGHEPAAAVALDLSPDDMFVGLPDLDWIFPQMPSEDFLGPVFGLPLQAPEETLTIAESASLVAPFTSAPHLAQQASPNAQEPAARYHAVQGMQHDSWLPDASAPIQLRPLSVPHLGVTTGETMFPSSTHFQIREIGETGRSRSLKQAEALLSHIPWAAVSLANFPANAKLDHCIDMFFLHFRPPISFIHRPTFDPAAIPEFLLFPIVAIGARFSRMSGAPAFALSMVEMTRRLLISVSEQGPHATRSELYFTALLLQTIHAIAVGDKALFTHGKETRPVLIHNARQVGLFQEPGGSQSLAFDLNSTVEERWRYWVAAESRRRLGWAIYNLDAMSSLLHNERPTFSTGDMLLSFPEVAARWEAPTAYAWTAIRPWCPAPEERIDFRRAARGCFDPSLPESIRLSDDQALYIIVNTLARFLWSIKELQGSPLMDAVPEQWPLVQHKRTLLDKMDEFLACPYTGSAAEADATYSEDHLHSVTLRSLNIHLCHLYGAGDLMDWIPAVLRSVGRNRTTRARMHRWAQESPARLREVTYHSAKILAISRDFPFNHPFESFYVFYAGAVLWCAATLLEYDRPTAQGGGSEAPAIPLDRPTSGDEAHRRRVEGWIRDGGDAVLGVYGVPDLQDHDGRAQVLEETIRILQNMRVWEISRAFSSVLHKLLRNEGRKPGRIGRDQEAATR